MKLLPDELEAVRCPGPCVICGDTNYGLSCGGPTICPSCDCGNFTAATVDRQAKALTAARAEIAVLEARLQSERGENALATADLLEEGDAQSALLKKAHSTLARIAAWHIHPNQVTAAVQDLPRVIDLARAVLLELETK